ncbi:MAG: DinB family protein [Candidatus Acidiferrales bacterium]
MTREERRQKLESFGRAPALLSAALRQFPKKMWLYKASAERWSIHEIILHLADNEANSYIYCRRMIAEPGSRVLAYNPAVWAGSLGYFHQSTKEALEIIRRLRRMTYNVLIALPEAVWTNAVQTPEQGALTLDAWLERQERHIPHHIDQMRENYDGWAKTHPPRKSASTASKNPSSLGSNYLTLSVRT